MVHRQLEELVADGYAPVVGAVGLMVGSAVVAEDAVQEALVRAWERLERGDEIRSLKVWVTTVALNIARSAHRRVLAEERARRRLGLPRQISEPTNHQWDDLADALRALPRGQRDAVVLHHLLDLSVADVAEAMGVSEGTVKTQLHRGREALRAALERDGIDTREDLSHVDHR